MSSKKILLQLCCAGALALASFHLPAQDLALPQSRQARAPDLDLAIKYYSRVLTAEGVLRESRHEERMMRRHGHVWVERVLPGYGRAEHDHASHAGHEAGAGTRLLASVESGRQAAHLHRHFNPVLLPRHVRFDGKEVKLEFVDMHEREVVEISPAEYENVNFDGSWTNAFHLVAPETAKALPVSSRRSPVAGARWREQESNGLFQRVLWDERRMIPLMLEAGDREGRFFRRVEVAVSPKISADLPWTRIAGFARKEYADFLD